MQQTIGKLFLIPSFLGENNADIIPEHTKKAIQNIDVFVVENVRTARRYLRAVGYTKDFDTEVTLYELEKHKVPKPSEYLRATEFGKHVGIISEAGNPCIADPGYEIVEYAHKKEIAVVPLIGPSSILLALISSGFQGQQFTFHGYLPIEAAMKIKKIKELEDSLKRYGTTHLFMETPFRNNQIFQDLIKVLNPQTLLSVACDVTLPTEFIQTKTCADWKKSAPDLHKRYCIFSIGR